MCLIQCNVIINAGNYCFIVNPTCTVIQRITVEPITDQSMQYNDLYVPQDPSQSKNNITPRRVTYFLLIRYRVYV